MVDFSKCTLWICDFVEATTSNSVYWYINWILILFCGMHRRHDGCILNENMRIYVNQCQNETKHAI